ncbi:early growth response protein 4 [Thrips palmi]|uniref:Early growth response protein 4 n=1 Tax=Thrips palmi TaxID=161013 RepID=A0A6P8YG21_THRPL|nr:early growth response protein 4 [Thrips palmi]
MEFSEAFRPEDIAKTDFFDFVVTPEDNDMVLHNNFPAWSRKSMGLFANNNNSSTEDANGSVKETNNNNILPNFAVDDSFWDTGGVTKAAFAAAAAAVNIKMESPSLEDINDICWPSNCSVATPEPADATRDKDTDGSIYTLTVVNGQDAPPGGQPLPPGGQQPGGQPPAATPAAPQPADPEPPPLWYRPPDLSSILREGDEQLRQAMSAMDSQYQTSLDIDSIISILPSMDEPLHGDMTHGAMGHGLFAAGTPSEDLVEDSGFVESKEDQMKSSGRGALQDDGRTAYSENNNDWAYSNHNDNSAAESLLRSALQGGKSSYLSQYSGPAKTLTELGPPGSGGGAPPDHASLGLFMSGDGMLPMEGMLFDDSGGGMYANGPAPPQCASACSSTTCMDDILLSPLDDYEKLKMIENEVAESAKRYGVPHHGGHYGAAPPPSMAAPHAASPHSSTPAPRPKKKSAKRGGADRPPKPKASVSTSATSAASAATSNGGARRERSLHHCTICSKAFKDKYSVNVHIRTHTGEKPFACSVCGKSFRQKAHLAKHYHTHIVQKSEHLGPAKALSTKAR